MAVFKQKKSNKWWYKFSWNGQLIRESTKQTNKRVAEQIEAAHKTSLAKGEVGIRDRKPVPTLAKFADDKFLPFVRATKAEKPRTITFYETTVANLKSFPKLAGLPLDRINSEVLGEFVAFRQAASMKVSTVNRELAPVRRMFHLAQEWGRCCDVAAPSEVEPWRELSYARVDARGGSGIPEGCYGTG